MILTVLYTGSTITVSGIYCIVSVLVANDLYYYSFIMPNGACIQLSTCVLGWRHRYAELLRFVDVQTVYIS